MTTNNPLDLTAPASPEAEAALLGCLLIVPDILLTISRYVRSEDFFLLKHRYVWDAMSRLHAGRSPIDVLTLAREMAAHKELDLVGGMGFFTELMNNIPSSMNAEYYAGIVEKTALRRRLMQASDMLKAYARDETLPIDEVRSKGLNALMGALMVRESQALTHISEAAEKDFIRLSDIIDGLSKPYIATKFAGIGALIGGYMAERVYIIGARPRVGKTTYCQSEALQMAQAGERVVYACMEQSPEEITRGLIAMMSGLSYKKLTEGTITEAEWRTYLQYRAEVSALPFWFAGKGKLSPATLKQAVQLAVYQHDATIVFVDYIGLMKGDEKKPDRVSELESISVALHEMAVELKLPFIVAAQLNRGAEYGGRPTLRDLKGSGSIEQDGDVVILLYRDDESDSSIQQGTVITHWVIDKNRYGAEGEGVIGLLVPSKIFIDVTMREVRLGH